MRYYDEILKGVALLATHPDTIFLGQSVIYPGHALGNTLKSVPTNKKLELPVFEETQLGMSIGLALEGYLPISIYPRFNFLLLAMNQLINHLDKISIMSRGQWVPKVIIRTLVGSTDPLHPGHQHIGDFTTGLEMMTRTIIVENLAEAKDIVPAFKGALERKGSTVLVEYGDLYAH